MVSILRLQSPRDRNGTFDPLLIAKYQRRVPEFDHKIVSVYERGMTTREIQGHIEEIYGFKASPSLISAITEAVMDEVTAWQSPPRTLLSYSVHALPAASCRFACWVIDAIRVNIRSDGLVSNKAVFVALGSFQTAPGNLVLDEVFKGQLIGNASPGSYGAKHGPI